MPLLLLLLSSASADPVPTPLEGEVMALSRAAAAGDSAALVQLAALCDAGAGMACGNLASLLRGGRGGVARVAEVPGWLEKGCVAGWVLACGDLGFVLARGDGVPQDRERGYGYTRQACDLGYAPSCGEAAEMLVSGFGVAADPAAARPLFERACTGESWRFCTQLAATHEQGVGGPVDLRRAEDTYTLACRHGETQACGRLPWVVDAEGDAARAFRLAEELCGQGVSLACVWSGNALRKGHGAAVDPEGAERRYDQACTADEPLGCMGLGAVHLEAGRNAKAKKALKRACELGMTEACGLVP